jgi:eukaryotic-like serine/threonine-protein kinase
MMDPQGFQLGPFQLLRRLGIGGMGEVWKATHRASGTPVAIKCLTHKAARSRGYRAGFRHEVRSVAALDHPNIIAVLDAGQVPASTATASGGSLVKGSPYLVMELADCSMEQQRGRRSWPETRDMLLAVLAGLAHAHARGVVHRDLKPANILLCGSSFVLADFGIAHRLAASRQAQVGTLPAGTLAFMPPEQIAGSWRDYGPWTDLYALGCVAWEVLTGQPPFCGTPEHVSAAQTHAPPPPWPGPSDVPPAVEGWLRTLLEKDPADRPPMAAEAARSLRELTTTSSLGWGSTPVSAGRRPSLSGLGAGLYGLRAARLVGRETERDALTGALERVVEEGLARAVVLRGPTGVGKSRLARWLCERVHERGDAVPLTSFHSPEQGAADGMPGMLRGVLRTSSLDEVQVEARTRAWLSKRGQEGLAGGLTQLQMGGAGAADPNARFALLRTFLRLVGGGRPLVLWLDDVQWGLDALDFAHALLMQRALDPVPVLLVLTSNDELLRHRPAEAQRLQELQLWSSGFSAQVELGPLSHGQTQALVHDLLGLEASLAARVAERVDGNPLFAVHLVGDWVQRKVLVPGQRGFELTRGAEISLPDDLSEVWASHLERLLRRRQDRDRLALEIAAALGRRVDIREWRAVCEVACGRPPAPGLLEQLVDHQLARRAEDAPMEAWSFVHGMLRESLEATARQVGRWEAHNLCCAQVLGPQIHHARLGRFLFAGGAYRNALDPLLRGARDAILGDHGTPSDAQVLLAVREEAMERMFMPSSSPAWGRGWLARATLHRELLQLEETDRWLDRVEEGAKAHGWTELLPELWMDRGRRMARMRLLQNADDCYQRAEGLYREQEDGVGAVKALNARARLWLVRDCSRSVELTIEAMEALADVEDPPQGLLGRSAGNLGDAYFLMGDLAGSEASFNRALELYPSHARQGRSYVMRALGRIAARRGQSELALERFAKQHKMLKSWAGPDAMADLANCVGEVARHSGDLVLAEAKYREAIALYGSVGIVNPLPEANLGQVLIARGALSEARRVLESGLRRCDAMNSAWSVAFHAVLLPCVVTDDIAWEHHHSSLVHILETQGVADPDIAKAAEHAAEIAQGRGRADRAVQAWNVAAAQWSRLGEDQRAEEARRAIARGQAVGGAPRVG